MPKIICAESKSPVGHPATDGKRQSLPNLAPGDGVFVALESSVTACRRCLIPLQVQQICRQGKITIEDTTIAGTRPRGTKQ